MKDLSLKEILELVKLGRELGSVILEIARALKGEDNEEAARLARSHGQASGRAAYEASKKAGPRR